MAEVEQPIIKKIYKLEGGHHGGAWKVAYADFVTAMMAFFLLLWLLSTTSKATKEAIADYFTPTVGIKDSMGIGFNGGEAPVKDGKKKSELMPPGVVVGQVPQGPIPESPKETMTESDSDGKLFEKAEQALKQAFESDPNLRELKDNIIVEQTPEGMKIQVMDSDKKTMFTPGTAELTEFGRAILSKLAEIIAKMPNYISVSGHTDSSTYSRGANYTNWELSADRANSARRFLLSTGMASERVGKVVGLADRELLLPQQPLSPKNRRVTIILLRGSHMNNITPDSLTAPRQILAPPQGENSNMFKLTPAKPMEQQIPVIQPPHPKPADTRPIGAFDDSPPVHAPRSAPPAPQNNGARPTDAFD